MCCNFLISCCLSCLFLSTRIDVVIREATDSKRSVDLIGWFCFEAEVTHRKHDVKAVYYNEMALIVNVKHPLVPG